MHLTHAVSRNPAGAPTRILNHALRMTSTFTLRTPTSADIDDCGRIIHDAFRSIAEQHGFPPDFPSVASAVRTARAMIAHPRVYGAVTEQDGSIIGSAFMSERDPVRGVGPVTVDPAVQARGAGRAMMEALLERAHGAVSVRLVQDAFNTTSMPLYASLGFEVKEPLALLSGTPSGALPAEAEVRALAPDDLDACTDLCERVHGVPRTAEVQDALAASRAFAPFTVRREGRVTAYTTSASMRGFGVAETDEDMAALLFGVAAATGQAMMVILPTRQAELFRWCLRSGLRVVKPMTLMTIGAYQDPRGAWFPSVIY
jgi:predicted N-acetyltransferase YhbS